MSFGDLEAGDISLGSEKSDSYFQLNEAIKKKIFTIASNVNTLQAFVRALGTKNEDHATIEKLNELTESTKDAIKSTNEDLHAIGRFPNLSETRKLQQAKLVSDLQNLIKRFQDISRIATLKEKEAIIKSKKWQAQTEEQSPVEDESLTPGLVQSQVSNVFNQELAYQNSVIAERESNIREIENAMIEVNEIFRDLGSLVNEQQWMLDNIEANIEIVHGSTRDATSELLRAQRSQKARRKSCCFIICICIVAAFVAILILSL